MNPVVHFEMPYEDNKRMVAFYEEAFGWKTKQMGPEMGGYIVASTTESDPNDLAGRPKMPGAINGGFYKKPDDPIGQYPSIVVAVPNLEESLKKIVAAGGKKSGEPQDIPGVGKFASIIDTEGNRISVLQPLSM